MKDASVTSRRPSKLRAAPPGGIPDHKPDAGNAGVDAVDCSFLQSLVGYNTRRASLVIWAAFTRRMAEFDLRQVDFSILSLVKHNPGITSRQLCQQLDILPPNAVAILAALHKRALVAREPHALDGRAISLFLTVDGQALMTRAEQTAAELELQATGALDDAERALLIALLQKIYK